MCNRYTIAAPDKLRIADLAGEIVAAAFKSERPRYNIAPSDNIPVLARDEAAEWHATAMRWGFVPAFDKSVKPARTPLNAKSETVLTSGIFRHAAKHRRCLLPADGFYEWHHVTDHLKVPHYFYFRDQSPFYFAGIYEVATEIRPPTCALLTTAPLATVAPFHSRSPLILDTAQAAAWTKRGPMTSERLAAIIAATRWGSELTQHVVAAEVGSTHDRLDGPLCIVPAPTPAPSPQLDLFDLG